MRNANVRWRPIADIAELRFISTMRPLAHLITAASALILAGCSYEYEMHAQLIDGKLAFVPNGGWLDNPECVKAITVETHDGPTASAAPGDNTASVNRGVYWEEWLDLGSCENRFPVFYGAKLSGPRFVFDDGKPQSVKPKPLIPGVVYSYFTLSDGSGGGGGRFKITTGGQVINLPR